MKSIKLVFAMTLLVSVSQAQVSFTNQAGLLGSGSGVADCAVDMNGDYLDDVVRVSSNGIYIDYQQSDGTFTQTYFPMSIQNTPGWSIAAGDVDGNGYNDLVFGNGSRVSFCVANDDGTAYEEQPHIDYIFSQRSTFADIDNDGNLDSFVMHDVDQSHPYRNDGNGLLTEDQTLIETLNVGGNYAAIWCDYDNDHDIDLYMTKCRGSAPYGDARRVNLLYRNNGDGTFSEIGAEANMNDGNQSWTTVFEDFDNDGDFDVFTVNHPSSDMVGGAKNVYKLNNGDGTFTDAINGTGLPVTDLGAWNCDAGDFDNNGFVDIFSEMSNELFLNNGDGTFTGQNINGFDSGGIGDFNDDGFLDVISGNSLWINDGNENNYVKVGLDGILSNKNGIGARIEIYGSWGIQIREIRSGESFDPMSSLVEHFGLGTATEITSVIVYWPSGMISSINNPVINQTIIIPEAECFAEASIVTVNGSLELCEGESTQLSALSGDSYTWSNGSTTQSIDVSEDGNYNVVVWDEEGCASISNTVQVTISYDAAASITISGEETFCEGGSTTLISSVANDNTWSNNSATQSIEVTESGNYTVSTIGQCTGDEFTSEVVNIIVLASTMPTIDDVEVDELGQVDLSAIGDNILWYDSEDGVNPIAQGNDFSFNLDSNQESFWVSSTTNYGGANEVGGKLNNNGGGGLPSTGGYMLMDVEEAFTLQTVTIYITDGAPAGNRTFWLQDENGVEITSGEFYLEQGENQVDLNFDVPVGDNLRIGSDQNNMFRNNSGVSYPYAIGSVGQITDSFYGSTYYYYFFNWQIQLEQVSCESDREEVMVSFVGIAELNNLNQLNAYPNPVMDGNLTLDINLARESTVDVTIYNTLGELVYSTELSNNDTHRVDVSSLAKGVYKINVNNNTQQLVRTITIE